MYNLSILYRSIVRRETVTGFHSLGHSSSIALFKQVCHTGLIHSTQEYQLYSNTDKISQPIIHLSCLYYEDTYMQTVFIQTNTFNMLLVRSKVFVCL